MPASVASWDTSNDLIFYIHIFCRAIKDYSTAKESLMNARRSMLILGAHGLALVLSGCMTAKLYENGPVIRTETIDSVFISSDEKYFVVLSEKHDYVFESSPEIIKLLRSKLHSKVVSSFSSLRVSEDGSTTISYSIRQSGPLTTEEQELAREMGFANSPLALRGKMKGMCYDSGGHDFEKQAAVRLNKAYTITVYYEKPKYPTSTKVVATPITLVADGLALALTAPLAPIALIPLLVFKFEGSPVPR